MFQSYIQKSTQKVLQVLDTAVSEMVAHRQQVLTPDFVLLALLAQPDSETVQILQNLLGDPTTAIQGLATKVVQQLPNPTQEQGQSGQVVASQELAELLRLAEEEARTQGDSFIGTGTLFIALFDGRVGSVAGLLRELGITREQARKALQEIRAGRTLTTQDAETLQDPLKQYTRDLTELARRSELDPVVAREEEIAQVIQTLSRRKKNNPVLIGEAGVGKTVIVEGLAQRIAAADVPDTLLDRRLLSLRTWNRHVAVYRGRNPPPTRPAISRGSHTDRWNCCRWKNGSRRRVPLGSRSGLVRTLR